MSYAYYYDTTVPTYATEAAPVARAAPLRSASLTGFTMPTWAPFRSASQVSLVAAYPPYSYAYNYPYTPQHINYVLDPNAIQLVENRLKEVETSVARKPLVKREVVNVPGPLGRVKTLVHRVPTPQPDIIERTYMVQPQKDQINVIIEKPATPAPRIITKQVIQDPGAPNVTHKVVRVPPRHHYHYPTTAAVAPFYQTLPVTTAQVVKSGTRNTFNTQNSTVKAESIKQEPTSTLNDFQSRSASKSVYSSLGNQ